ncbi:WD repeat-containing protein 31 [Ditylenchus destructor]|uniref:WD repeat-containing protein 31 n=1 Tax=Ditylenchus destructor TaxID=166010 RepID=A0AAD4R6C7_9BILA|nr:WD repeat-containing protein 31 [Ditylenchus destructor]
MGSGYSALATSDDNDLIIASSENINPSQKPTTPISARSKTIIRPAVHLEAINWLAAVRTGMVISASSDKTIVLNNLDTGACVMRWRGHEREVTKVIYKHVGCKHIVLSGSKDCTVRIWQFNSTEYCNRFDGHEMGITGLAALDDTKFVSASRDGRINIWDVNVGTPLRSTQNKQNLVTHIEFDSKNQLLYQTSEDGCLKLWDARDLRLIHTFPSKSYPQWHCDICPSSELCLTSNGGSQSEGSEVSVWDIRQRKLLREFYGHEGNVRSAIFLNVDQVTWKKLVLSVSSDGTARIWNLNTGMCLWTESIHAELNSCVAFADGSIAIGGSNSTLCDMRVLARAGRPYLHCHSLQQCP